MDSTRLIDQLIRTSFPHPVAASWHRVSLVVSPGDRIQRLFSSLEVFVRFVDAVLLADYLRGPAHPKVETALVHLEKPALGHWVQLLRGLVTALDDRGTRVFMPEVAAWYGKPPRLTATAKSIDELVKIRNHIIHGHPLAADELEQVVASYTESLRQVMGEMSFLASYRPFRVMEPRMVRGGGHEGRVQFLTGIHAQNEPVRAHWGAPLYENCVYVTNPDGTAVLEASPFLQVVHDDGAREQALFVVAQTKKHKRLVLKNDVTGKTTARLVGPVGGIALDEWLQGRPMADRYLEMPKASPEFRSTLFRTDDQQVLGNRFEVRGRLGEGGMATVYQVWDQWDHEDVALKVLHNRLANDTHFRERFTREARTMKQLAHPNIVTGQETGQLDDGRLYLKMPMIPGGNLQDRVDGGPTTPDLVRRWGLQMLSALAYLHERGIVHRDIKPSNFLVDDHDNVFLTDFGIAVQDQDVRLTGTLEQMGSVAYMSPEQRRGGEVGPPTDLFSLGVVLHELITGRPGVHPPGRGIGGPLGALVKALCADDPDDRPNAVSARSELTRWQPTGEIDRQSTRARGAGGDVPTVETLEVPPGQFEMAPGRTVEITVPVQVSPRVTRLVWQRVTGGPEPLMTQDAQDDVSWLQAVAFCNALSEANGLTPAYTFSEERPKKTYGIDAIGLALKDVMRPKYRDAVLAHFGAKALEVMQFAPHRLAEVPGIGPKSATRYAERWNGDRYFVRDVTWDRTADGYRLPTEAEWVHTVGEPEGDVQDWVWCADPGPSVQPVPTPLPQGHFVDPSLDAGALRLIRSASGRQVLAPDKHRAGLGLRVVRGPFTP